MGRVQRDASDSFLRRFRGIVLSVADDGMSDGRKLYPDLVLQSGHQTHADERRGPKTALDGIAKFSASRFGIAAGGHLLKHSLLPKVVNERAFGGGEMSANDGEILAHRSVEEKLLDQRLAIGPSFCKKQDAGRVAINTMHDQGSLSSGSQFLRKKRECGGRIRVIGRHGQEFGRFIERHYGFVFIELDQLH